MIPNEQTVPSETHIDLTELVPIIESIESAAAGWPGPIEPIIGTPFAISWCVIADRRRYDFTDEHRQLLEAQGIDWRRLSMKNLEQCSLDKRSRGRNFDADGRCYLQVLLHEDAIGPSRLLLPHFFDESFDSDYLVAIPEQTCAILFRVDLAENQASIVDGLVEGCFEKGTKPMSNDRFDPRLFWSLLS